MTSEQRLARLLGGARGGGDTVMRHYVHGRGESVSYWGVMRLRSGAVATNNPFRFSTKYADGEAGLVYYGYRFHSPELGRWMSRDPQNESQVLWRKAKRRTEGKNNLYAHSGNGPISGYDYLGLYTESERVAVCADYEQTNPDIVYRQSGGVVCKNGTAYPCLFGDEFGSNSPYAPEIKECALRHEETHARDAKCDETRPRSYQPVWPQDKLHESECEAFAVMWECLKGKEDKFGYYAARSKIEHYLNENPPCPQFPENRLP